MVTSCSLPPQNLNYDPKGEPSNPIEKKKQKTNEIKDVLGPIPLDINSYGYKEMYEAMVDDREYGIRKMSQPVSIPLWRRQQMRRAEKLKKSDNSIERYKTEKTYSPK